MGPFFDTVYDEAPILCGDGAEVGTKLLELLPEIPLPAVLTHADIDKLKVVEQGVVKEVCM